MPVYTHQTIPEKIFRAKAILIRPQTAPFPILSPAIQIIIIIIIIITRPRRTQGILSVALRNREQNPHTVKMQNQIFPARTAVLRTQLIRRLTVQRTSAQMKAPPRAKRIKAKKIHPEIIRAPKNRI